MTDHHPDGSGGGAVWPDGSRLALSVVVNVEEGAERSVADGDSGPDPVDEPVSYTHLTLPTILRV